MTVKNSGRRGRVRVTKSQTAYEAIRRMVISNQLLPGHPWSMRRLAEKFGMSVVPVSEAVRRLEQEGVLQVSPQRGINTVQPSAAQVQELAVMREGLEVQAARILAQMGDQKVIETLMQRAAELQALLREGEYEAAAYADYQLHRQLVESAGSPMLLSRFDQVATLGMLAQEGLDARWADEEFSGRTSHLSLIKAVGSGDPDWADREMRKHIGSFASRSLANV